MRDPTRVSFRRSDEIVPAALAILDEVRSELTFALPGAELALIGSSSLPGLLTRGDVDLHLRIPPASMPEAVRLLDARWTPVHVEMWTPTFVTYEREVAAREVGVAVTAIGGEHDLSFRSTWMRMATEPALRAAYDALKRRYDGEPEAAYREAKARFFAALDVPASARPADGTSPATERSGGMQVRGIVWAGTRTVAFDETIAFFRDVLGVPLDRVDDDFAWARMPDTSQFEVFGGNDRHHLEFTTGPVPEFLVDDLAAAIEELRAAGVEILGRPVVDDGAGNGWVHFRAPDGNVYGLTNGPQYARGG